MKAPTRGSRALDASLAFITKYVAFPTEHCGVATTLWAAHTHAVDAFYVTPRLVLDSAEPGSGKTRVLELLNLLCRDPEMILSPTVAALFRMIAEGPLTLLFDEVDVVFNPKSGGNFEDLRGMLNAGYKRGNTIPRCVGDAAKMKVQRFKVFAPVAMAGIAGNMPATITTRAVTIHMRKRKASEHVAAFRERDAEVEAKPIRDELQAWVDLVAQNLEAARPTMPTGVVDRPAECWEALLAVADAAGGDWPERARAACRYFVLDVTDSPSLGVRLLRDLRKIYGDADRMPSADVIAKLITLEESPWASMWGDRPIDAGRLARELKRYEVGPVTFAVAPGTSDRTKAKGYVTFQTFGAQAQAGLADAWERHAAPEGAISGNHGNRGNQAGQNGYGADVVTAGAVTSLDPKPALTCTVTAVTAVTASGGPSTCLACRGPIDSAAGTTHPTCAPQGAAA